MRPTRHQLTVFNSCYFNINLEPKFGECLGTEGRYHCPVPFFIFPPSTYLSLMNTYITQASEQLYLLNDPETGWFFGLVLEGGFWLVGWLVDFLISSNPMTSGGKWKHCSFIPFTWLKYRSFQICSIFLCSTA